MRFCYGDEENAQCACTNEHLTTANQSEIGWGVSHSVETIGVRDIKRDKMRRKNKYEKRTDFGGNGNQTGFPE